MNLLLTGGAGYIGSHAVRRLLRDGHRLVIVDDYRRGKRELLQAACAAAPERTHVLEVEIADREVIGAALREHRIDAVMHFAAYIEVGESVRDPFKFYRNNFCDALTLLETAIDAGVRRFVFSSTAAVYGEPAQIPIAEDAPRAPVNPYGRSKMMLEMALEDACRAYGLGYVILRYFNVAGASPDAAIGEWHEPETHLIPRVLASALASHPISVFGDDYDTRDGTCVRDYIHVEDLVDAHARALMAMRSGEGAVYNLGSERGFSVREVIAACEEATQRRISVQVQPRRVGDPPTLVAASGRIRERLGWARRYPDLGEIIRHAWAWQKRLEERRHSMRESRLD